MLDISAFCSACTTHDVGLHLQAQGSLYMFSLCHDLSIDNKAVGYFGERIANNLVANQVSAAAPLYPTADMMRISMASSDHSLSYEWVNAYQESWEPYDIAVRLASAQSPCQHPGEQCLLILIDPPPRPSCRLQYCCYWKILLVAKKCFVGNHMLCCANCHLEVWSLPVNLNVNLCFCAALNIKMTVRCRDEISGKEILIDVKGSRLKFKQDFPMSPMEMLTAMREAGGYHIYCILNIGSGCNHHLVKILHPSLLVQQGELKYRLRL